MPPAQPSVQPAGSSLVVMALGLKSTTVVLSPFLVLALFSTFHKNDLKPGTLRKTRPHAERNERNYVEKGMGMAWHSRRFPVSFFCVKELPGLPMRKTEWRISSNSINWEIFSSKYPSGSFVKPNLNFHWVQTMWKHDIYGNLSLEKFGPQHNIAFHLSNLEVSAYPPTLAAPPCEKNPVQKLPTHSHPSQAAHFPWFRQQFPQTLYLERVAPGTEMAGRFPVNRCLLQVSEPCKSHS